MSKVADAATTGVELDTLRAMRDRLASAMDTADDAVVAQVAGRLEAVLKRISELAPATNMETLTDVLAERRADRERHTKSSGGAAGRKAKPES